MFEDHSDWHSDGAIRDRAARIKRLLAALKPFAEERETKEDRAEARACMAEIKEWL